MKRQVVSSGEIAAFVEGIADPATARRVLAASLSDPYIRRKIETLRSLDDAFDTEADYDAAFNRRAESLRDRMLESVVTVFDEMERTHSHRRTIAAIRREGRGGALAHVSANILASLRDYAKNTVQPALRMGRHPLTLPCLAPATASMPPELAVRRQSLTADGVRIEFQQMPGTLNRLRVFVDASGLTTQSTSSLSSGDSPTGGIPRDVPVLATSPIENKEETESGIVGYNVAYLTLEDGDRNRPDRHILVVSLNAEGRGFTDYVVGGEGLRSLPAPRTACALIGATLSRLDPVGSEETEEDEFDEFDSVGLTGGI